MIQAYFIALLHVRLGQVCAPVVKGRVGVSVRNGGVGCVGLCLEVGDHVRSVREITPLPLFQEGYPQEVWRRIAEPSRWGRKKLIFCLPECIFAFGEFWYPERVLGLPAMFLEFALKVPALGLGRTQGRVSAACLEGTYVFRGTCSYLESSNSRCVFGVPRNKVLVLVST